MRTSTSMMGLMAVVGLGCGQPAKLSEVQKEVFEPSCAQSTCHGTAAAGSLSLTSPSHGKLVGVAAKGTQGKTLVVAGQVASSYLYEKVSKAKPAAGDRMPPGVVLTATQLELVRSWIEAGAKDD